MPIAKNIKNTIEKLYYSFPCRKSFYKHFKNKYTENNTQNVQSQFKWSKPY